MKSMWTATRKHRGHGLGLFVAVFCCLGFSGWGQSGTPVNPTPINPTPINPTPITPTPITPTPITPTPIAPTTITPTPINPTPITPTTITPTPITPTEILTPPEPRLPDAIDSDGDGYLDYAEEWYGSNPNDALQKPADMTPEQANFDPGALQWYNAGWGRLNIVPVNRSVPPPGRMALLRAANKTPVKQMKAPTQSPGMSGGDAALVGLGVGAAVVAAVAVAGAAGGAMNNYQCSDGYSLCTDGVCCPSHLIGGVWGAYHIQGHGCYGSAASAANASAHGAGFPYPCVDERRQRQIPTEEGILRAAIYAQPKK